MWQFIAVLVVLHQTDHLRRQIKYKGQYLQAWVNTYGQNTDWRMGALSLVRSVLIWAIRAFMLFMVPTQSFRLVGQISGVSHIVNFIWLFLNVEQMLKNQIPPPGWYKIFSILQAIVTILYLGYWLFGQFWSFIGR